MPAGNALLAPANLSASIAIHSASKKSTAPRLTVDLIPSTAWESNVRNRYPDQWDVFRRACYRAAGHRCEICGTDGRMECHEVWSYEKPPIQKLERLICLCPLCHSTQHYGLATIKGITAEVDAHIRTINGWTKRQLVAHLKKAFDLWDKRNKVQWKTTTEILDKAAADLKNAN